MKFIDTCVESDITAFAEDDKFERVAFRIDCGERIKCAFNRYIKQHPETETFFIPLHAFGCVFIAEYRSANCYETSFDDLAAWEF